MLRTSRLGEFLSVSTVACGPIVMSRSDLVRSQNNADHLGHKNGETKTPFRKNQHRSVSPSERGQPTLSMARQPVHNDGTQTQEQRLLQNTVIEQRR